MESVAPNMLLGRDNAGQAFAAILKDAEKRVTLHPETMLGTPSRLGDIRLHTQFRQTYADPREKRRVSRAACAILDGCKCPQSTPQRVMSLARLAAARPT